MNDKNNKLAVNSTAWHTVSRNVYSEMQDACR